MKGLFLRYLEISVNKQDIFYRTLSASKREREKERFFNSVDFQLLYHNLFKLFSVSHITLFIFHFSIMLAYNMNQ